MQQRNSSAPQLTIAATQVAPQDFPDIIAYKQLKDGMSTSSYARRALVAGSAGQAAADAFAVRFRPVSSF